MAEALLQNAAARLGEAYKEFDRALRLRQAKAGYYLALALMPAGMTLDAFVYPGHWGRFCIARLLCDVALLPCLFLLSTPLGRRFASLSDKPVVLLPSIAICWMIYATDGAASPYYAGLNLMVVGACLLIPYRVREAAVVCGLILLIYAGASVIPHASPVGSSQASAGSHSTVLFNNLYFLALTSIICVTACHYSAARRFEDFRLRHELDANNQELAAAMKKLQETEVQLVQSEKMNALGKLSAGLLHEINNPLNFTFMALQVAQQDAGDNTNLKETLTDIEQGMGRIRSVVSDLRAFAYPSKLKEMDPFLVDDALTTAMRLTAHETKEIQIDRTAVNGARAIGSQTQIVHVLMNLLMNSCHAVRAKNLGRSPQIAVTCEPRNGRMAVRVRDNGTGVKKANLPRLFEPFFTTKEVGQGTGLGLSICHTIVLNHGGSIDVSSEEGQWTEVVFDLPLAA